MFAFRFPDLPGGALVYRFLRVIGAAIVLAALQAIIANLGILELPSEFSYVILAILVAVEKVLRDKLAPA